MANTLWEKISAEFTKLKEQLNSSAAKPTDNATAIAAFQVQLDNYKAESDGKDTTIATHTATIADLTGKVAAHVKTIEARDATITANTDVITKLKAAAKTAGQLAVDMLASCGIKAEDMPAAGKNESTQAAKPTLMEQYRVLLAKDSVAAAKFYAENSSHKDFWK